MAVHGGELECENTLEVNDQQEKMIQALDATKKNSASVLALSKSLSCDDCKSFARAPIQYCGNHGGHLILMMLLVSCVF